MLVTGPGPSPSFLYGGSKVTLQFVRVEGGRAWKSRLGIYYPSESHVKSFTYVIHLAIVVYFIVYIINAFVFSKYQFPYNSNNNNKNNFMHFHTYTVSSVSVTFNVLSSRQGTFSVTCTASGGTVVSSSLTGPGGVDLELQPVVSIGRTGQNTYSITSGTLSGRSNGDT